MEACFRPVFTSEIGFRASDGRSGTGFVKTASLCAAVVYYTDEDGDKRGLQELEYADLYGSKAPGSSSAASSSQGTSASAKRTGTQVVVFGQQGAWDEIEHEGLNGFVHEDYLTIRQ